MPGGATAQTSSTKDILETLNSFGGDTQSAGEYYLSLSPEQQNAVMAALSNPDVTVDVIMDQPMRAQSSVEAMSASCTSGVARASYASLGILLFRLYSGIYWCYDGYSTWGVESRYTWAEVYSAGWDYNEEDTWGYWENWGSAAYKFVQAHFRLCWGSAGCVQNAWPWLKIYGEEDGTLNWDQWDW